MPVLDHDRDHWIRAELTRRKLDALVCRLPENVVCLTGYYPQIGCSLVIYPREGEPVLICPRNEREAAALGSVGDARIFETWRLPDPPPWESIAQHVRQVIHEKGLADKAIGWEGSFEAIAPSQMAGEPYVSALPTRRMIADLIETPPVDATETLNLIRARKTPIEIDRIRRANEIAALGLRAFAEQARPGRTEAQVAAAVEATIYAEGTGYRGARYARAWAQVFSGPNTIEGWYYPVSTGRIIQDGDLVMIELGTVVDGYWSDLTRTVVAGGKATQRQRDLDAAVRAAQHAALLAARPGVSGREPDAAARRVLAEHGLDQYFVHHTGHGLGFRYHEPYPSIHPASTDTLEVGHIHSIEPGVYLPQFGGLRVEDNAVITESGAEYLARIDVALELP